MNLLSPVKEMMTQELITISENAPMTRVKEIFSSHKIHHIPVVESSTLIGMISKSDYLFYLRSKENDETRLATTTVADVMTRGVARLAPDDRLSVALAVFKENLFHSLPVVEDGRLVGILTTYDIISALSEKEIVPECYG